MHPGAKEVPYVGGNQRVVCKTTGSGDNCAKTESRALSNHVQAENPCK